MRLWLNNKFQQTRIKISKQFNVISVYMLITIDIFWMVLIFLLLPSCCSDVPPFDSEQEPLLLQGERRHLLVGTNILHGVHLLKTYHQWPGRIQENRSTVFWIHTHWLLNRHFWNDNTLVFRIARKKVKINHRSDDKSQQILVSSLSQKLKNFLLHWIEFGVKSWQFGAGRHLQATPN